MKQLLNTLYVTTEGAYLNLEGETLVLSVDREKKAQVPLHHLGSIVCIGRISMSPALMERNMQDGRSIVWLNDSGKFQARVEGPVSGNILLRQAQYRKADVAEQALELAKAFIAGKIRNARTSLLRSARDNKDQSEKEALTKAAKQLATNLRNLEHAVGLDVVRGLEGDAAKVYFSQLNLMVKPQHREGFTFNGRNRRPPRDPFNALLSFLYAILLNDCRSALESVGLDSQLGYLHQVRPGRHALALDLLEEFRATIADRLAVTLINRGQIQNKHFDEKAGGSVLLNDEGRKAVIIAYQERKKEMLQHPLIDQSVEIGLLPLVQARILARYLRDDIEAYVPYLYK